MSSTQPLRCSWAGVPEGPKPKGPGLLKVKQNHFPSKFQNIMKAIGKLRHFCWLAEKGQRFVPDLHHLKQLTCESRDTVPLGIPCLLCLRPFQMSTWRRREPPCIPITWGRGKVVLSGTIACPFLMQLQSSLDRKIDNCVKNSFSKLHHLVLKTGLLNSYSSLIKTS